MVTVFGLGFVGLTTALGFAHMGYKVYGIDVDIERINTIASGTIPFHEPYMQEQLQKHIGKNFIVGADIDKAISDSEYIYYCVGTPYGKDGTADLKYLFSAIDTTLNVIHDDKKRILVTKSTIPPSTTKEKIIPYIKKKCKEINNISIANNPEFLREGHCWEDFINSDRIVCGCNDEYTAIKMRKLYEPMNVPIFTVSLSTGEFIKYLSNTLLATLISYANEMAQAADVFGDIDIAKAFKILHMDSRWNDCNMTSYVYPGCGYGGYCLPKDTCAFYAQAKEKGFVPEILGKVIMTNENRTDVIVKKIISGLKDGNKIGILGLSFKPNSDDVRDTPAARIIHALLNTGNYDVIAFDPLAMKNFQKWYPDLVVDFAKDAESVCKVADEIVIATAWNEFKDLDFGNKNVVDCRYMLER